MFRTAADNICGGDSLYTGGQGSSVIKIFDMTAAATGINEKAAKAPPLIWQDLLLKTSKTALLSSGIMKIMNARCAVLVKSNSAKTTKTG